MDDKKLAAAIIAAADAGEPLSPVMAARLERWLGETWGDRVNGDDLRRVSATYIAIFFADDDERDPAVVLGMADEELLPEAQTAVERVVLADDEMDLPGAVIVEIENDTGLAWIVNIWGGGYIASQPPQEFLGPFATRRMAEEAMLNFGFSDSEEVTLSHLPPIRAELAEMVATLPRA